MRRAVLVTVASFAFAAPIRVHAQGAVASVVAMAGSRVRVTVPGTEPLVGTLLSAPDDTLRVELEGGSTVALAADRLTGLEVSGGVRRRGWQGAGIGFLVGGGIGAVVGFATYRRTQCSDVVLDTFVCSFVDQTSREVTVVGDAAMAGLAGAIVGALIGHTGRETWIRVPVRRDGVRVGLTPTGLVARVQL